MATVNRNHHDYRLEITVTIGITGASGELGRLTAEIVLRTVDPREVVLVTRRPERLADLAARGAEVRQADFTDEATLVPAFTGVDKLLLVSTDAVGQRLDQHRAAVAAAAQAGVGHVVYTSFPGPSPDNPAEVVPDHAGTEQTLRDSGMRWTMLRNNLYAHMQVPVLEQAVSAGRLVTNAGSGAVAYVTREDCAAVAAAVLTQDGHEDTLYDVTGPSALTAADLAAVAGEDTRDEVELVQVDDESFAAGLRQAGLPDKVAALLTSFGTSARRGFLSTTSTVVADLTGRGPTSLADVLLASRRT